MALSTDFGIIVPPATPEDSIREFWEEVARENSKKKERENEN